MTGVFVGGWIHRGANARGQRPREDAGERLDPCQGLPATRSQERGKQGFFVGPFARAGPCDTFILDFQRPELGEDNFLLFRPPGSWSFICAATLGA